MTTVQLINLMIQIWGITMLFTILLCMFFPDRKKRKSDIYYIAILSIYMGVLICEVISLLLRGRPGNGVRIGVTCSNFMFFFLSNVFSLMFLFYENEYLKLKAHKGIPYTWLRAAELMLVMATLLLFENIFYPFMYRINGNNEYERMDLYFIVHIYYYIIMLIGIYYLFKCRKELKTWEFTSFLMFVIAPFITEMFAIKIYGIVYSEIAITSVLVCIYVILQAEYGKRQEEIEREVLENQLEVMMSQIGPHFVFNALNSIEYLCNIESPDAPKAIEHFQNYLKVILGSISENQKVSFLQELDHVNNYLYIEKLRFPDIQVDYELTCTDFMLPPLTLQPIVENSIKHGLRRRKNGGHVMIQTKKLGDTFYVIVEDDGVGFDTEQLDRQWNVIGRDESDRSHVGLQNVKSRLELVCGGTCRMESTPGVGTTVTLAIPQEHGLDLTGIRKKLKLKRRNA